MPFPLSYLPLELALEIFRLAASPIIQSQNGGSPDAIYATACALALVSYNVRKIIMPLLLHTVIFSTQENLGLFIRTVEQQAHFASANSRLKLDYTRYVWRIWSSQCWEPLVQQSPEYDNYSILYPIFSRARTIGFNSNSMHLFYEILGGTRTTSLLDWNCKRIIIAGDKLRWNSIVSTAPGLQLLRQITHLTLWSPMNDCIEPNYAEPRLPNWVERVPLESMPNLTYFAFTLIPPMTHSVPILVYTLPPTLHGLQAGGSTFRKWISGDNPLDRGPIYELGSEFWDTFDFKWETAFAREDDDIWNTRKYGTTLAAS